MSELTQKTKFLNCLRAVFKLAFLERILVSFTQGKSQFSFVGLITPNNYQYNKGSVRQVIRGRINYQFDLSDKVDWFNYFGFEELERENFYNQLKPGNVVLDVGANMGEFCLKTAQKIGDLGKVIAFEPDAINFKRLSKNLDLNPQLKRRIVAFNFGLGASDTMVALGVINESNRGMNRVVAKGNSENLSSEIKIQTLDNVTVKNELNQVDWIKIDVEGYEFQVLQGSKAVIEKYNPAFFIELDDSNLKEQGDSAEALIQFFENLNYKVTHAETGEELKATDNYSNLHFDIIAKAN